MRRLRAGHWLLCVTVLLAACSPLAAQVIHFESNGMAYQVLTREGLTLMCAAMPFKTSRYAVMHIAVSNGSRETWQIDADDFVFEYMDGTRVRAATEERVVGEFFRSAGRSELLKLQTAYEKALYNNQYIRPNNSYEKRRLSALAFGPKGLKASAAAAAITFVSGKVGPGDSTDGALFFPTSGRQLGPGRIVADLGPVSFEFLAQ